MFEIINNMIENLVIALFICFYLDIREKRNLYVIVTVLTNALVSTVMTKMNIIGFTQTMVIQSVFLFMLYVIKGKLENKDIMVSLFCNILLILGNYFIIFILSSIFNVNPIGIFADHTLYIILVVSCRIMHILLCYFVYKQRLIPEVDAEDKKIEIMLLFEFILCMIMVYYFVNIVISSEYNYISNVIYVCFIFIFVSFYMIFNEYLKVKKSLYNQKINERREEYIKKNINNLKRIKDDINNKDHRINYILQLIESDINKKDYDKAKERLKSIREIMYKIEPAMHSGNEVFDFMINMKAKEIHSIGKRIKISSFISVNNIYNEYDIYNNIINIIDIVYLNTDKAEIYLGEEFNFSEVKFIIKDFICDKEDIVLKIEELNISSINIEMLDSLLLISYKFKLDEGYSY